MEALAWHLDRRFFPWEIEFPELFFGFVDGAALQIRHKERIKQGAAGFDGVAGNLQYEVLAEKKLGTNLDQRFAYFKPPSDRCIFGGRFS